MSKKVSVVLAHITYLHYDPNTGKFMIRTSDGTTFDFQETVRSYVEIKQKIKRGIKGEEVFMNFDTDTGSSGTSHRET